METTIRLEGPADHREVENLVRESFWNVYRPGALEHFVLHRLRDDPAFVPELDFVMEKDGRIVGQNVFVRANIRDDGGRDVPILTMGPICIAPDLKRRGLGKKLLDFSLEKAASLGFGALASDGRISASGFQILNAIASRRNSRRSPVRPAMAASRPGGTGLRQGLNPAETLLRIAAERRPMREAFPQR